MINRFRRPAMAVFVAAGIGAGAGAAFGQADAGFRGDTGIFSADPSVIRTDDGYVSVESRSGRTLFVRIAPSLDGLADAEPVRIWSDRQRLGEVWAPEIVFRDGRYAVYFAAGIGSAHRMYSIQSSEPAANYGDAVKIALPDDKWAIDGLAFSYRGADYFVWSGWLGDTDVRQDTYIVRLGADGAPDGPRVLIGSPDQPWENVAGETPSINEGQQPVVDPAGQLHIVYSANGSWGPNYCLADLRLRADGDPLDADAWSKSRGCLFGANAETIAENGTLAMGAKGVGHHSVVLPDGNPEQAANDGAMPFLYHGVPADEQPSNFWSARKWFIGSYQWVPDVAYGSTELPDTGWSLRFSE